MSPKKSVSKKRTTLSPKKKYLICLQKIVSKKKVFNLSPKKKENFYLLISNNTFSNKIKKLTVQTKLKHRLNKTQTLPTLVVNWLIFPNTKQDCLVLFVHEI